MSTLTCKIVRPDKQLFEGEVTSLVLMTRTGELGVLPGHSAEICALGDGVLRVALSEPAGEVKRILISGGYAEITPEIVIVLATHARDVDDIDVERVREVRDEAVSARDAQPVGDHGRMFFENKIHWCDLLLKQAGAQ